MFFTADVCLVTFFQGAGRASTLDNNNDLERKRKKICNCWRKTEQNSGASLLRDDIVERKKRKSHRTNKHEKQVV